MAIDARLPPHLQAFVREQLAVGRFQSEDELISAALILLAENVRFRDCDRVGGTRISGSGDRRSPRGILADIRSHISADDSRTLLLCADLAVVPCKASLLEVRALKQATLALHHARRIRKGRPKAVIVLSMVGQKYRLTQDMRAAAAGLKLPVAKTALTLRQVYADAPGQGVVVWQLGTRAREAARQIKQLCRELLPGAEKKHAGAKARTKTPLHRQKSRSNRSEPNGRTQDINARHQRG